MDVTVLRKSSIELFSNKMIDKFTNILTITIEKSQSKTTKAKHEKC